MFITNPEIEAYLKSLVHINDSVLEKMENLGHKLNFPIVDRLVGNLLYIITQIKKPKLIVELGSGFGYSAYWFAKGLEDGKVVLNDYKEENINLAKKFFKEGNLYEKAIFEVGDAVENAKKYNNIDILFLDHEKSRYLEAIKQLENNLSKEAIIIADNVLWHGKVIEEDKDKKTEKINEFNEYMSANFKTSILPLRDGVLIALKK
ncbi:O-methyltransferase [Hydrogenothermus marinus]|uniref:Putative O-methyltransferase YrrM n=1 Tax=Hydrogenothermus marinus TaxID=133270 RepID=A0A3M0BM20_9AQUI|nr:O-methyltransferase [Hydrogenothermus marinus]RMA97514.1 putative O-methyltransferase YrrM [Hydrogenothermus marinus]